MALCWRLGFFAVKAAGGRSREQRHAGALGSVVQEIRREIGRLCAGDLAFLWEIGRLTGDRDRRQRGRPGDVIRARDPGGVTRKGDGVAGALKIAFSIQSREMYVVGCFHRFSF